MHNPPHDPYLLLYRQNCDSPAIAQTGHDPQQHKAMH